MLRDHGFPQAMTAARQLRDRYVQHHGVRRYLCEMLGERAKWPAGRFRMWRSGQPVALPPEAERVPLVEYLSCASVLPDRIEFGENGRTMTWEI